MPTPPTEFWPGMRQAASSFYSLRAQGAGLRAIAQRSALGAACSGSNARSCGHPEAERYRVRAVATEEEEEISTIFEDNAVATFIQEAEDDGVLDVRVLDAKAAELDLDDEELAALRSELEVRGVELTRGSDDGDELDVDGDAVPMARASSSWTSARRRRRRRLADAVHERDRQARSPHGGRGGRAREEDRARRPPGKGAHDQLEPAPRRLDREALPGARSLARRPDPGGRDRPQSRRREVRLAQGLQVLDVRDLVDPPGVPARGLEPVAHHPRARPRPRAQDEARAPGSSVRGRARPGGDDRGARGDERL